MEVDSVVASVLDSVIANFSIEGPVEVVLSTDNLSIVLVGATGAAVGVAVGASDDTDDEKVLCDVSGGVVAKTGVVVIFKAVTDVGGGAVVVVVVVAVEVVVDVIFVVDSSAVARRDTFSTSALLSLANSRTASSCDCPSINVFKSRKEPGLLYMKLYFLTAAVLS